MSTIRFVISDRSISVYSPYNTEFVRGARRLAGQWSGGSWSFPIEVLGDVRALCREVYGADDQADPADVVRLRVTHDNSVDTGDASHIVVAGREVACVFGRDSGARLGQGIVLREGKVSSGGSRKNYRLTMSDTLVFDLLRVPRAMAARMVADHPDYCRIVADDGSEMIEQPTTGDNVVPFDEAMRRASTLPN